MNDDGRGLMRPTMTQRASKERVCDVAAYAARTRCWRRWVPGVLTPGYTPSPLRGWNATKLEGSNLWLHAFAATRLERSEARRFKSVATRLRRYADGARRRLEVQIYGYTPSPLRGRGGWLWNESRRFAEWLPRSGKGV